MLTALAGIRKRRYGADVRCGSLSTKSSLSGHVRFTPSSDRAADIDGGPVRIRTRHVPPFASDKSKSKFPQRGLHRHALAWLL